MFFNSQTKTVIELVQEGALWIEDGNHGENRPLAHEFSEQGTPFVRPDDLANGSVSFHGCDRINDVALRRIRKGKGRAGDIVFTHRATVGRIARVGIDAPEFVANPGVTVYRTTCPDVLDTNYLYYFMQAPYFMRQVWAEAGNTDTFPYVSLTQQRKLKISYPNIQIQRAIGAALGIIDDRITQLRETNATLEAIAQALFKSRFVDFDPVRAKAEGRQPEGMDATTAALFPDSFEESELGLVPKGWEIGALQDLLVLQRGFDLPASERTEGQFPLIAASGPNGTHNISMAHGPGVVTGRSGVLGKVFLTLEDYWPLNTTLWVKEFKRATPCYAFELLKLLDFASFNAGSAVPTLNRNHVHSLRYVLPPIELVKAYEGTALSIHQRVLENNRQSQTLTQLRDTLLPRLISGQLRLPEAEALIEEAV